jgi:esterase/lipase superfamily enzyme
MERRHVELHAPAIGGAGVLLAYGQSGPATRPVLVFPTEGGNAWEYETSGMVDAVAGLVDAGRVKLFCVGSYDEASWSNAGAPLEERARAHGRYEAWILEQVVPWIHGDCGGGAPEIVTTGCSLGGYHAANFALKRADVFPLAVCLSGNYDPATWRHAWGERGDETYFNSPIDYVANLDGDHLDWLRERVSLLLVCGQGRWEDTTGALESTLRLAERLRDKGIRHELDLWGHDVPHDWPSWRAQIAHHLPRFC